jgi:hypothetical protein
MIAAQNDLRSDHWELSEAGDGLAPVRSFPKEVLGKAGLTDHYLKRSSLDFTAKLVRSDVNVPYLPIYNGPIVAMAGSLMAI